VLVDTGNISVITGPNVTFWKFKMAAAYLGQFLINLHQIWYGDRYRPYKCHRRLKITLFENRRWRRPPSWKMHKIIYLSQFLTDLHQIWCAYTSVIKGPNVTFWKFKMAAAYLGQFLINLHQIWYGDRYGPHKCHRGLKMSLFGNSRWWRPPSLKMHKRVYLRQCLISLHRISCAYRYRQYKCPKCHFLKIQDDGGRHLGKYTKGHISANSWSIWTKSDTVIDMGHISVIGG